MLLVVDEGRKHPLSAAYSCSVVSYDRALTQITYLSVALLSLFLLLSFAFCVAVGTTTHVTFIVEHR
jgi:hypothetical protein